MAQVTQLNRVNRESDWTRSGPVDSRILPGGEIATLEARAAATVADPAPLGLWGFATGTWILGTVLAGVFPAGVVPATGAGTVLVGVFPASATSATIPVLLVFAGIAQFIAGLFAFRRASVLDATAFCSLGAFNVLTAGLFAMQLRGALLAGGDPMVLQGFVLLSFGFIAIALTIAALPTNLGLVVTFGLLTVGYTLTGIAALSGTAAIGQHVLGDIGGWFLVASAFAAYYLGMALLVNSTFGRMVLPIGGNP